MVDEVMSLLKLTPQIINFDPIEKAKAILASIPSKHLICEAYLFGSSVNGVFTKESDLDFIVVVENDAAIEQLKKEVYRVGFSDIAIDWIFKLKSEFEKRKDFGGVCFEAFHYGKRLV